MVQKTRGEAHSEETAVRLKGKGLGKGRKRGLDCSGVTEQGGEQGKDPLTCPQWGPLLTEP